MLILTLLNEKVYDFIDAKWLLNGYPFPIKSFKLDGPILRLDPEILPNKSMPSYFTENTKYQKGDQLPFQ